MADPQIDIEAFLEEQNQKDSLRFITCGSVDDGKSTLLGRLLYDSTTVFEDQLSAAKTESQKYGTQGDNIDLALLVDGLQAEREQGITIDVAYRFFETDKRKFIAADTPGHAQYTRNMATGASNAEAAVVLIDARKGVLEQTRRHSWIVSLFGISTVVLAVNKMDLVDYDQTVFEDIKLEYQAFAEKLGIGSVHAIPLSALSGHNVFKRAAFTPWYDGPTLIEALETIDPSSADKDQGFRMPVQWVNRPNADFRGFSGTVMSGSIKAGDKVASALSDRKSTVKQIIGPSGDLDTAVTDHSITMVLNDEIDVSRGDCLVGLDVTHEVADQFAAHILWMDEDEMLPERAYAIRFSTANATAQVTDLVHAVDVNTHEHLAAKTLQMNNVGYCKVSLDKAVAFDAYKKSRGTGCFVLIDKFNNRTVGAGVVEFALRRASNVEWHTMKIDKQVRASANNQKPCVLWFTGFSGSGKSTIADKLEQKLHAMGKRTYLLDGDNVRHGLNRDLGFTDQDRVENIRRVAEVSRLMVDAGLIVVTAFISPFHSERQMAREMLEDGEFIEVYVDTPLEVCEARDPKGLYKKARSGELKNFTGIDSDYEPPQSPEITLAAGEKSADELADQIVEFLMQKT